MSDANAPRYHTYEALIPKRAPTVATPKPSSKAQRRIFNHLSSRANLELSELYSAIDTNGDDTLTPNELIAAVENDSSLQRTLLKLVGVFEAEARPDDYWQRMFGAMDANNDGNVTYNEFVEYLAPLPQPPTEEAAGSLSDTD